MMLSVRAKILLGVAAAVVLLSASALAATRRWEWGRADRVPNTSETRDEDKERQPVGGNEPTGGRDRRGDDGHGDEDKHNDDDDRDERRGKTEVSALAGQCGANIGPDGTGVVTVTDRLVVSGKGTIGITCTLRLEPGASLTFKGARVESKTLGVVDAVQGVEAKPNGKTKVSIAESELIGEASAAFVIALEHPEDEVSISRSTLDYPTSVGISVPSDAGSAGERAKIAVSHSALRSTHFESQGIWIIGAEAVVSDARLESFGDTVVIMADRCKTEHVSPRSVKCLAFS